MSTGKGSLWDSYELRTGDCKRVNDLPGLPHRNVGKCNGRDVACNVSSTQLHQTAFVRFKQIVIDRSTKSKIENRKFHRCEAKESYSANCFALAYFVGYSQINAKFVIPNSLLIAWIYRRLNSVLASSGTLPD